MIKKNLVNLYSAAYLIRLALLEIAKGTVNCRPGKDRCTHEAAGHFVIYTEEMTFEIGS